MSRWEVWLLNLSTVGVSASGLLFAWMKYLLENRDPFALINHPWQPATLSAHLLLAPVLVFAVGLAVRGHVARKLRSSRRENRLSGLVLLGVFVPMALSGYGLQIVTSATWSTLLFWSHLIAGGLFTLLMSFHSIAGLVIRRRAPHPVRSESLRRVA